jgi:D-3-phosphoglycerate dehydrogenase
MKKVLIVDKIHSDLKNNLIQEGIICEEKPYESKDKILRSIHKFDGIIIRSRFKLDKYFINKASNLKFIARFGSGMENIDLIEAKKNQIKCINAPTGNSNSVGEHTLGLLLSLTKKIQLSSLEVNTGKWIREKNRGIEISNKTIGIIGYGNTGTAFSKKLLGFGCKVLAYDKYKKKIKNKYVRQSSMNTIFKNADILSLHVPLTNETRYLIDHQYLNKFSKNIFLINTSRGKIIKTSDLIKNIKTGKIIGAGLDVVENENINFENLNSENNDNLNFLKKSPNVILTPHIAGWSHESNILMSKILTKKILSLLKSIK